MAEAAVQSNANRFYCHQCTEEINPKLPEFTCPRCDNGFIEEITEGFSNDSGSPQSQQDLDPAAQFAELWGRAFLESFRNQSGNSHSDDPVLPDINADSEDEDEIHQATRHTPFRPLTRIAVRTNRPGGNRSIPNLHGLLQLFVQRLSGDMGQPLNILPIHGNPGDYAWGSGGLDNIITQLEGSGAPPADKSKIDSLPTVKITKEQVERVLQCSICMDDFKEEEEAKKLPCDHHYHKDCIDTWLKML
ncbi:hypothetical protein KUTeg_022588 [Tegillarca granosa]|uniref:RING-type E3 ubiquitin transferase n=1 Tax=Tegillarca granosa TaxID=220873 RepID=A0ABQ9E311_TEGGR|nr:hypothetical protein KUTeg_022588 [Tegillarca granosa]